jgi:hypothetical protein
VVLRAIAAVLVLGLTLPGVALARGSSVHVLLSPTRRGDAQALRDQAVRVSRLLASRTGSVVLGADDGDPSREEPAILQRAQRLAAAGALDDAAAVFDAALDTATHAPSRVADSAELVTAHVTRASIALARGESGRAEELLERVLRFDPGFALLPTEDSPRMRRAVEEARRKLGSQPELRAADLGRSCASESGVLVVARSLGPDRAELLRFDDCKLTTTTALRGDDEPLAAALLLPSEKHRPVTAALVLPAPLPEPTVAPPEPPPPPSPPMYRRAWFWTVIGVVAAGSVAAIWATQRDKDEVHVVPHL